MCINAKTSFIALILGELSGLGLILSNNKEKQMLGFYVMFYSLIQLFELNIYLSNYVNLNSRLLLLNLGSQGIIFFLLMSKLYKINFIYLFITSIVFFIILLNVLKTNFDSGQIDKCKGKNTISNCIKWNFLTDKLNYLIYIMYFTMLLWWIVNKKNIKSTNFINKAAYYFIATLIIFYTYGNINQKRPGYWCLASALLAPILLIID